MNKMIRPGPRRAEAGLILALLAGLLAFAGISGGGITPAFADQPGRQPDASTGSVRELTRFGFSATVPDAVEAAAQDGLQPYLDRIPKEDLEQYGFPPGSGFDGVSLGQPFRVMTIPPDVLYAYKPGDDIRSMLQETTMWFFPIVQKGVPRTILTVDNMAGQWKAVAIGSAGLARQLHGLEQAWPRTDNKQKILVLVFQASSDFIIINAPGAAKIVPLEAARVSLHLSAPDKGPFDAWPADEVVARMIPVVRENINQPVE